MNNTWSCINCGRANRPDAMYCYNCNSDRMGDKLQEDIPDKTKPEMPDFLKDIFEGFNKK